MGDNQFTPVNVNHQKCNMVGNTLNLISFFFVLSGILCLVVILLHIYPRRRQPMAIMDVVWPLTGLWAAWVGLWAYWHIGQVKKTDQKMEGMDMNMPEMKGNTRPKWQSIALSTLHCGAGCTLADLVGESFTLFVPISVGGSLLIGQWILDYILALLFGVCFQYAAIRHMQHLPRLQLLGKAFKTDFFSLTAWQTGMYGWMAIVFLLFFDPSLPHTTWLFWFMMQIAMVFGFLVAYPVNWLLIKSGIKQAM